VIAQMPFTRVVLEPEKKSATVREFEAMLGRHALQQTDQPEFDGLSTDSITLQGSTLKWTVNALHANV
jgi:hypothetical protein